MLDGKQKRAFHSILSGLKFAKHGNKKVRFLTLTTSNVCFSSVDYDSSCLNSHFQVLKKRIKRYTPFRLFREGYITKNQMVSLYRGSNYFKPFNFEYFKVVTNEGNGVIHVVYRGSYLPHSFLVDNWMDIHLSWDVDIRMVDLSNPKGASCYVVSQYVGGQGCSYVRSSQSWNWVFRGFKSLWYSMKYSYPDNCIELWDLVLRRKAMELFFPQSCLSDFG